MRLLVYPHDLSIGGSQINSIDLAAATAAAGHDVIVYGVPGPLVEYVKDRGLTFLPAKPSRYRPSPWRIAELARIVARERVDLVHCYEWSTCLDAYFGAGLILKIPLLCTVLSMQVMPYVPSHIPLIMGTAELGREARKTHGGEVSVIEPPIDVERDTPDIDGRPFRRACRIGDDEPLIVSVSRLALDLKLDALVRAIDAVDQLAQRYPVRLALVGDGEAEAALAERASRVNRAHRREVVTLAGAYQDPRGAYAAADIVVGMGSSALRALAIGRSLVVQGERGFSETFEPATSSLFLEQGFYGVADNPAGGARLAGQIEALLTQTAWRRELEAFGRRFVVSRFSLEQAAEKQMAIYRRVLEGPPQRSISGAARSARLAAMLELSNHDPRRKRTKTSRETQMLIAAGRGAWPPA